MKAVSDGYPIDFRPEKSKIARMAPGRHYKLEAEESRQNTRSIAKQLLLEPLWRKWRLNTFSRNRANRDTREFPLGYHEALLETGL